MQTNQTGQVYESLSTPPVGTLAEVLITVLMSLGVFGHVYVIFVLRQTKLPSLLTSITLYRQSFLDASYAILTVGLIITNNFTPTSNQIPVHWILCHVFQSGVITYMVRVATLCNVVGQSVDRFLAVAYPQTYRSYTNYYAIFMLLIISAWSVLACTSRMVQATLVNGSCKLIHLSINGYLLLVIDSLLRFCIPISIFLVTNLCVIRKLFRLQLDSLSCHHSRNVVQHVPEVGSRTTQVTSGFSLSLQRTIFKSTLVLAIGHTLNEITTLTLMILNFIGVVNYNVISTSRVWHLCTVVSLNNLNPVIEIVLIKKLRDTVISHWHKCSSVFRINWTIQKSENPWCYRRSWQSWCVQSYRIDDLFRVFMLDTTGS